MPPIFHLSDTCATVVRDVQGNPITKKAGNAVRHATPAMHHAVYAAPVVHHDPVTKEAGNAVRHAAPPINHAVYAAPVAHHDRSLKRQEM